MSATTATLELFLHELDNTLAGQLNVHPALRVAVRHRLARPSRSQPVEIHVHADLLISSWLAISHHELTEAVHASHADAPTRMLEIIADRYRDLDKQLRPCLEGAAVAFKPLIDASNAVDTLRVRKGPA